MNSPEMAVWVGAVATLAAVLVALFKDELLAWWRRPVLVLRIELHPPDCHKTSFTDGRATYYLRIWVENRGRQRANQVQVFAAQLLRRHADSRFREDTSFLPMNLRWSHTHEIFADGISPRMGKHCDLGSIPQPDRTRAAGLAPKKVVGSGTAWLSLDLEVLPNTESHILEAGVYRLELHVAAANSKPRITTIEVTITGAWSEDESEMFSKGIGLVHAS